MKSRDMKLADMKSKENPYYSLSVFVAAALCFLSIGALSANAAETLPLDSYLQQVEGDNQSIRASREASEGAGLRASEGKLVYSPILSAGIQRLDDHKLNALFPGAYEKIYSDLMTVGLSQQTSFGTEAKVSYTLTSFHYVGSQPKFWEGLPRLELSQQLLGGGFGSSTRAQKEILEAGARVTQFSKSYNVRALRSQAEGAYINLAATRELREINENSLKRGQDILDWNSRRFRLNLGENSDLLQAQANMESIKLQLQNAIDSERIASREFNRLRNVDGDSVADTLILPSVDSASVPARAQYRDDVRAAIENTRVAAAQAIVGKERNKPMLEVYGSYALNARKAEGRDAVSDSFRTDYPTSVFGLRFQTPLLIGAQSDAIKGYAKEAVSAEIDKDQKLFDQEIQWKDLNLRLLEAKKRYGISVKLYEIQNRKAIAERARLRRGRTTTYQSLLFDQELSNAEAMKIRAQAEILQIVAQMKTFGGV